MIESRGVATSVIALVRPHIESTQSPRGLWVPFPLGRPLGEPEDAVFQRRVLRQALALLERTDGPVLLEDFADDAPSMTDNPGWRCSVALPHRPAGLPAHAADWVGSVNEEMASIRPHWQAAQQRFGRSTVGISRLPPQDWAAFAVRFLEGGVPDSPVEGLSPAVLLRFVADDLKALYSEAAQSDGPQPSAAQINAWFWDRTVAADLLRALRTKALDSPHNGFNTAGSRFLVPAPFVDKA